MTPVAGVDEGGSHEGIPSACTEVKHREEASHRQPEPVASRGFEGSYKESC